MLPGLTIRNLPLRAVRTVPALLLALVLAACRPGDSTWLTYEEVFLTAGHDHSHGETAAPEPRPGRITWTAPERWNEEPASGMRMGAFTVESDGSSGVCTIISLSGPAGGTGANINRWIGQLGLPAMPPDELARYIEDLEQIETAEGRTGLLVDLGALTEGPEDVILAGIFELPGTTLFVKFSGPRELVDRERAAFLDLCRSIRTGEEP